MLAHLILLGMISIDPLLEYDSQEKGFHANNFWDAMQWQRGETADEFYVDPDVLVVKKNYENFCDNLNQDQNQVFIPQVIQGISHDEIPIFIMMGKYGAAQMYALFDELENTKTNLKLKYLFICGKNESLKKELEQRATKSTKILGLLTPEEMNEVMNFSMMGISKAGGATVSEAIATKTPLLLMGSYPWEEANADHLVEIGLGAKVNANESIVRQIERMIITFSLN